MGTVFVFYEDDMDLIGPLEALRHRFERVQHDLSRRETVANPMLLQQLSREHSRLVPIMAKFKRYQSRIRESRDLITLAQASDPEMQKMAQEELAKVTSEIDALAKELQLDVLPKDPNEDRNIILEIRAGAGGDEAGLFAADLLRMYQRYAEVHGWVMEPIDSSI